MESEDSGSDSSTTEAIDPTTVPYGFGRNMDPSTVLAHFPLLAATPENKQKYVEKTAGMFWHFMSDYHQERLLCENNGTAWQHDAALHERVYQTQLLTMAFLDGHYHTPALVIETFNNYQKGAVIHLALRRLKELYPTSVKANMDEIFIWPYHKHGPWLIDNGFEVDFIERRLNTTLPVAMATTQE